MIHLQQNQFAYTSLSKKSLYKCKQQPNRMKKLSVAGVIATGD
jgi:hypothetical protein